MLQLAVSGRMKMCIRIHVYYILYGVSRSELAMNKRPLLLRRNTCTLLGARAFASLGRKPRVVSRAIACAASKVSTKETARSSACQVSHCMMSF